MSQILVTGGAGYIGSHVNKGLSDQGLDTVVIDNLIYGHVEYCKWGSFILADLNNKEQLQLIFKNNDIQAVMHFAAFAYVGESVTDPRKYYLNNLVNTINLLDVMLENNVKKIVFSSTCATYGIPRIIPIPESHAQNPINAYGRTKFMIENVLSDYDSAYGLRYASLRYFNAAGADPGGEIGEWHEPETHLIPLTLDVACGCSEAIKIFGTDYDTEDGTCIRDYIHVSDLAQAHILALEYLQQGGKSDFFNLGNGNGFSVRNVIDSVRRITRRNIKVREEARRPGDPPVLIGNSQKARQELGWKPQFAELDAIVSTAWNWHQKLPGLKEI